MTFDPTVSLGNVIALLGFVLGGMAAFYGMQSKLEALMARIDGMEKHLGKLTDVIVADARHEARLDSLEQRVTRLEKES